MGNRNLAPSHEQELRNLDPAKHPDIAALLNLVDGQRSVIQGKDAKIERQSTRLRVLGEELTKRNQTIADLEAEIARLREQSA